MKLSQQVAESALTFALLSPALIWAAGCVYLLIYVQAPSSPSSSWLSPHVAMLAFLSLVSVYVATIGPALAVGATFGWVRGRFGMSPPLASLVGFGLGFAVAFAAAHVVARMNSTFSVAPGAVGMVAGLSALVSALVVLRRLRANNPFEPPSLREAD
jgi:hypothetical protein